MNERCEGERRKREGQKYKKKTFIIFSVMERKIYDRKKKEEKESPR